MRMDRENKTARVFLACAIGAGIGTLSALQLGCLWGLGALIGGLAAIWLMILKKSSARLRLRGIRQRASK